MQGGPRGRGGGLLGGLFGGNKGRGQQQQFGGGMQGGQRQQQFGQQGQQFGQQGGYMGYQRSAPEIFRQEAPRQLQDAMVFLQPAAVMTAAAILGVAVFSDVGGSGGVDNARYKAASKVTLALDLTLALHFLPPRPPSPTFARTLTTDGSIPGASTPLHLPPLHPFTLHHPSTPSPLHPLPPSITSLHPLHSTLHTPHSTFQGKSFSSSRSTDSFKMPKTQDYSGMSRDSAEGRQAESRVGAAKSALSQARSAESSAKKAEAKARDAEASAVRQAKSAEEKAALAKKEAVGATAIAKKRTAEVASALSELDKAEAQVATVEGNAAESRARAAVERAQSKAAAARDSETRALALSSGI